MSFGWVPPVADEREGLLAFLTQQRTAVQAACFGLDDAQAGSAPSVSALSLAGLVTHLTAVERGWVDRLTDAPPAAVTEQEYHDDFALAPGQTLADALAAYERVAERTEQVVRGIADLGQAVPVPRDAPWYPTDVDAWSVRWVLLHLVEETARHAGHADIVRETVDGATCWELLAALQGWAGNEWLQPWRPRETVSP